MLGPSLAPPNVAMTAPEQPASARSKVIVDDAGRIESVNSSPAIVYDLLEKDILGVGVTPTSQR